MNPVPFNQMLRFAPRAEVFLKVDGEIVRADKVLKEASPHFATDGVRLQFNYVQSYCRALAGNNVRAVLANLPVPTNTKISLTGRAGLKPAGGSIMFVTCGYMGDQAPYRQMDDAIANPTQRLIDLMDTVVGNLGTLIDPTHARRTPAWQPTIPLQGPRPYPGTQLDGFYYDTMSNWWLQSYQLMSLVYGMSRFVILAHGQTTPTTDYTTPILNAIKLSDIHRAIETGDADLALANWIKIEPVLIAGMAGNYGNYPLDKTHQPAFRHFLKKGANHWFNHDLLTHWRTLPDGHNIGWEAFLTNTVYPDMAKKKA